MKIIIIAKYHLSYDIIKYLSDIVEGINVYDYIHSLEYDNYDSMSDIGCKLRETIEKFPNEKFIVFRDLKNGVVNEAVSLIRLENPNIFYHSYPTIDIQFLTSMMNALSALEKYNGDSDYMALLYGLDKLNE